MDLRLRRPLCTSLVLDERLTTGPAELRGGGGLLARERDARFVDREMTERLDEFVHLTKRTETLWSSRRVGVQVGQDGKYAPMRGVGVLDVEFGEQMAHMRLDGPGAQREPFGDTRIGEPLGHEGEDVAFALGQQRKFPAAVSGADHGRDYLGIEGRSAVGYPLGRFDELVDLEDAVLEEIAEAWPGHEVGGVRGLDVLGEQQDTEVGVSDLSSRAAVAPSSV